jgi:cell division protein FtsI/penicillin-binding protein 2
VEVRTSRGAVALSAAALIALGAFASLATRGSENPAETANAYLSAWEETDWRLMRKLVANPPRTFEAENRSFFEVLHVTGADFSVDEVDEHDGRARARFTASLRLEGLPSWRYRGALTLIRANGEWRVEWSRSALHPALRPGLRIDRERTWPERAPILAADGTPLATDRPVIRVGIQPSRIKNRPRLLALLARHLDVDPSDVAAELDRPGVQPDWFIPVAQLRPDRYARLKPKLHPIPGTVFMRSSARLRPSDAFAAHVVGDVGDVTAEQLAELGDPYMPGDHVGLYGLERVFEPRLAGQPSGEVRVIDEDGRVVRVLARFSGKAGTPLRTTFDPAAQAAAEEALTGVAAPAALVAVDPRTGAVRAAVSRPLDEFNRALAGRYPPGSTFKIVTTGALLTRGIAPDDAVPCPEQTVVGGKAFRNAEGAALGSISFGTAFTESCNTAFVRLAAELSTRALARAAAQFGFGARYDISLDVAGGRFPSPRDTAERAAAAIGQGRVEASPLHMATVAGAVAAGGWRPPVLLASGERAVVRRLEPVIAATLRALMEEAVEQGTGEAAMMAGLPVAGKTGTAEYGDDNPPRTHAWFVGFRGDLAFAVLVEGGGFGGDVAAPIARRFLTRFGARSR